MIFSKPKDKSFAHEKKGDAHAAKKDHSKALESYKKALELDATRIVLYDKLIDSLNKRDGNWSEEDFASSLTWTMKKQELEDPAFKRIHARSEPEYQEAMKIIKAMMTAKSPEEETLHVETLKDGADAAIYPLVDFLLTFKEIGKKTKPK